MKKKRTLYECSHARVKGERIRCRHGHPFSLKSEDRGIEVKRLVRGEPLALNICQTCSDFDRIGSPVPEEERGWLKNEEASRNGGSNRETLREAVAAGRR
jgi:hypothetical protein